MRLVGGNETAPGEGRGVEAGPEEKEHGKHPSKIASSSAMSHAAKADLNRRAAEILARSIFSNRLTNPDVHTLEEALRALFEREAYFHERQAYRLLHGNDAKERLEAAFATAPDA